jgi:glycosyltransferase involved in cell wall biosynthesis
VVLDDMSTDGTAEHLAATLPTHDRVVFVRNRVRRRKLENTLFAFRHLVERPDAIVFVVDGDDRLLRRSAVAELAARHRHADVVWSQFRFSDGRRGFCGPCPASPRTAKWRTSHLKSFKRSLFDRVPDAHLRDADGRVLSATEDMAYMFPMLELAGPRRRAFVDEELYFYRVHGGNMRRPLQLECEAIVRGRPPLAPAL